MKKVSIHQPEVSKPNTMCRVLEDNFGALEMENTPKLRPRTKHLSIQLHHFCQYLEQARLQYYRIKWIPSIYHNTYAGFFFFPFIATAAMVHFRLKPLSFRQVPRPDNP